MSSGSSFRWSAFCFGFVALVVLSLSGCKEVVAGLGATDSGGTPNPPSAVPSITSQPSNATVTLGQAASFSVTAAGAGTLTYQWEKNSVNIPGATSANYTTPATTAAESGSAFSVVVSDSAGNTTSKAATLQVNAPLPPSLSGQPERDGFAGAGG